jgi:hypothetical protein
LSHSHRVRLDGLVKHISQFQPRSKIKSSIADPG